MAPSAEGPSPVTADGSLAIVGGLVLRSTAAEPEPLDVIVRDGRIAALNPPGSELPPGLPVLDAARTLIIPGLVNAPLPLP